MAKCVRVAGHLLAVRLLLGWGEMGVLEECR
jgi:hypothetical protein